MEEKNKMKVVKGGKDTPEVRKLSYEELENTAHQLSEQSRQLYMQNQKLSKALQEANLANFYERVAMDSNYFYYTLYLRRVQA